MRSVEMSHADRRKLIFLMLRHIIVASSGVKVPYMQTFP